MTIQWRLAIYFATKWVFVFGFWTFHVWSATIAYSNGWGWFIATVVLPGLSWLLWAGVMVSQFGPLSAYPLALLALLVVYWAMKLQEAAILRLGPPGPAE